jgi:membrane protein YdbS with pleckstrin-like domain
MTEVLPPEDKLVPAPAPELKLRHLPAVAAYAGLILAVGAGILAVAALAFVAEMVAAAAILALVAVLLLIVVPIAYWDARKKDKARRAQPDV